jgi:hypothetical protein
MFVNEMMNAFNMTNFTVIILKDEADEHTCICHFDEVKISVWNWKPLNVRIKENKK